MYYDMYLSVFIRHQNITSRTLCIHYIIGVVVNVARPTYESLWPNVVSRKFVSLGVNRPSHNNGVKYFLDDHSYYHTTAYLLNIFNAYDQTSQKREKNKIAPSYRISTQLIPILICLCSQSICLMECLKISQSNIFFVVSMCDNLINVLVPGLWKNNTFLIE